MAALNPEGLFKRVKPVTALHSHVWSGTSSSLRPTSVPGGSGEVNTSDYPFFFFPSQTEALKGLTAKCTHEYQFA